MDIFVRRACSADLPWLGQLMVDSSVYNIPYTSDVPNQTVRELAQADFDSIAAGLTDNFIILVAEDEKSTPLGTIVLRINQRCPLTGELQSEAYTLAVEPKYWGTKTAIRLNEEAARISAESGHPIMIGHLTAANRRMKVTVSRMGFELEGYELVMACNSEGPTELPEREPSQRAHDVSRRQRQLLAKRRARKARRAQRNSKNV